MADIGSMGSGKIPIDYENELKQRDETIARLTTRIQQLEAEIEELKKLLTGKGESKTAQKPKFTPNYSLDRITRKKRRHRDSTGRRRQETKQDRIEEQQKVYWPGVDPATCICHRQQFAWRMIEGKAVYVCYAIYDVPESKALPLPPGLRNSRSEFGIEIILILAFLHYWIGVSLDHAREILQFFTGLDLSKSQADSLLSQLAADWDEQYDTITALIALSLIVYIDETAWKVGQRSCYTWAFSTAMYVLFRCGVGRGKAEAQKVLGEFFAGIGVTDDYQAYTHLFREHQLCWAHLLCKAIKLALQHPDEKAYAEFLDALCAIYRQAVRYRHDHRLSVGRREKVAELQARIRALCTRYGEPIAEDTTPAPEAIFIRLQNELVDHLACLFVFVEHPEVEPTNNRSERTVRHEAEIRKGGRTSKTPAGAQRRSVIMTVFASLRTRFPKFTLFHLLSEVQQWLTQGRSIFEQELAEWRKANAPPTGEPALVPNR